MELHLFKNILPWIYRFQHHQQINNYSLHYNANFIGAPFSAVSAVSSNSCIGSLTRIKISFFL